MKQTRRDFIKNVAMASAGLAVGLNAKSYSRIIGANDRVNFAIIGLNGRGYAHLASINGCKNSAVAYICDVDSNVLMKFEKEAKEKYHQNPVLQKDFRKMLESKDVDAITIAAPDHWHTHMAIMGLAVRKTCLC